MKFSTLFTTTMLLLVMNAYAQGNQIHPTVEHKAVIKNAPLSVKEANQKRFNDSVALRFFGYELTQDPQGQPMLSFKYTIENKAKRNIRIVQWAVNYIYDGQIILTQDTPVTFKDNLKRRTTAELVFSVPLSELSPEAQAVFKNPQVQLNAQFEARQIVFSNGSKIIVAK
ncbi:hypothetical protein [Actinobacillus vicugnae]|uniref:hypothetical protein n=1 Tax=Actinobacillus vicugnae TaxID=2573093 RepID=UPI00123F964D|nr:hypothetical protein [Actinobacillus vicugnae]